MWCYVYVLGSREKGAVRTYVGWTTDLEARLRRHNTGRGAKSTRGRRWVLLYGERWPTRSAAMSREWHLKRARALRRRIGEGLRDAPYNEPLSDTAHNPAILPKGPLAIGNRNKP